MADAQSLSDWQPVPSEPGWYEFVGVHGYQRIPLRRPIRVQILGEVNLDGLRTHVEGWPGGRRGGGLRGLWLRLRLTPVPEPSQVLAQTALDHLEV